MKLLYTLFLILSFFESSFLVPKTFDGVGEGYYIESVYFNDPVLETREAKNLFDYYTSLTSNLGNNPSVLCVYFAIGMVASYYDTYFNDDIITDEYDVESEYGNYYCYNGYKLSNNQYFPMLGVTNSLIEAYVIGMDEETEHICSDNYYVETNNDIEPLCPCFLNDLIDFYYITPGRCNVL